MDNSIFAALFFTREKTVDNPSPTFLNRQDLHD